MSARKSEPANILNNMERQTTLSSDSAELVARTQELDRERQQGITRRADRQFAFLALFEWVCAICAALWIAPRAWSGQSSTIHPHVWIAIGLGGFIISLPVGLAFLRPGTALTRHVTAASQMLMAGLLVHMNGGRLETHFIYFGLLAFLSFYYDWRILVTATVVAGSDHVLRAIMWPESMYGVPGVTLWRPLEHAAWVVFEVVVLILSIQENRKGMRSVARRQARLEGMSDHITSEVKARTAELADSEERYRFTFENNPLPMWLCDVETLMFLAVNQQAVRKYGYSEAEFLRMHTFEIRPAEDLEAFKAFLAHMPSGATPIKQWRHRKKDGTIMDVEVTSQPAKECARLHAARRDWRE
jgi:PAS domain S-box-containing protein